MVCPRVLPGPPNALSAVPGDDVGVGMGVGEGGRGRDGGRGMGEMDPSDPDPGAPRPPDCGRPRRVTCRRGPLAPPRPIHTPRRANPCVPQGRALSSPPHRPRDAHPSPHTAPPLPLPPPSTSDHRYPPPPHVPLGRCAWPGGSKGQGGGGASRVVQKNIDELSPRHPWAITRGGDIKTASFSPPPKPNQQHLELQTVRTCHLDCVFFETRFTGCFSPPRGCGRPTDFPKTMMLMAPPPPFPSVPWRSHRPARGSRAALGVNP